tara:strand:- start:15 stop:377 length:363 start_codon:yes stop_codon:yes gene_type:complete
MIFGNYTVPEGAKLYADHCRLAVDYLLKNPPQLPEYVCTPQFVPLDYFDTVVGAESSVNLPEMFGVQMLVLFATLIFGIIILELVDKKFGYLIDPVVIIFQKRYDYVTQRNRLQTMNGHP